MKLRLVRPEEEIDFVRHARRETVWGLRGRVSPALLEPIPCATYWLAYKPRAGRAIGMAEIAVHDQVYCMRRAWSTL